MGNTGDARKGDAGMAVTQEDLESVLRGVRAQIDEARGLPGWMFHDAEVHALERERIFSKSWVCVGAEDDLPRIGDVMPVEVAGRPLFLVRDETGYLRCFHNICSHRGALLVTESGRRKVIACPYHSWTYGLDGALKKTPHICGQDNHEHPTLDMSLNGLKPVRCATWARLVFVNLDPLAPSLDEELAPLAERWSDHDLSLLRFGGAQDFVLPANWKLGVENFVERYHLPWVHPSLNGFSGIDRSYEIFGDLFVGVGSRKVAPPRPHGPLPTFPDLPESAHERGEYPALFPNVLLGLHADSMFAYVLTPDGPHRTKERLYFFFVGDESLDPRYAAAKAHLLTVFADINREDMDIVARLHRGCASPAMPGAVFSPVFEKTSQTFQRMVAERLAGRAETLAIGG
jgi:choline monooxygenase